MSLPPFETINVNRSLSNAHVQGRSAFGAPPAMHCWAAENCRNRLPNALPSGLVANEKLESLARRMKATQDDNVGASKGQETAVPLLRAATNSPDLEIKDAQLIFGAIWRELEREFGRSRMHSQGVDPARGCAGRGQRHQLGLHSQGARHHRTAYRGFPAP